MSIYVRVGSITNIPFEDLGGGGVFVSIVEYPSAEKQETEITEEKDVDFSHQLLEFKEPSIKGYLMVLLKHHLQESDKTLAVTKIPNDAIEANKIVKIKLEMIKRNISLAPHIHMSVHWDKEGKGPFNAKKGKLNTDLLIASLTKIIKNREEAKNKILGTTAKAAKHEKNEEELTNDDVIDPKKTIVFDKNKNGTPSKFVFNPTIIMQQNSLKPPLFTPPEDESSDIDFDDSSLKTKTYDSFMEENSLVMNKKGSALPNDNLLFGKKLLLSGETSPPLETFIPPKLDTNIFQKLEHLKKDRSKSECNQNYASIRRPRDMNYELSTMMPEKQNTGIDAFPALTTKIPDDFNCNLAQNRDLPDMSDCLINTRIPE